jgi:hypothetical protein
LLEEKYIMYLKYSVRHQPLKYQGLSENLASLCQKKVNFYPPSIYDTSADDFHDKITRKISN